MAFVLAFLVAGAPDPSGARTTSSPYGACAAAKLNAAAKKAAGKLKCYASAIKAARAVDLACLLKVETKFDAAFVKAEAKGGCVKSGDTDAVERDVDAGVATIVAGEPGSPESQWVPLVARSWTMPAGSEGFRCRRIRVQSDMYVTGVRAVSPPGVFSMIVSVSSSTSSPIGDYNCSPNQIDQRVIYESGIGTDDLEFPLGVGVHLHAGDYVNLNVHLDNGGTKDADGIAGVLARTGPPSSVINDAALVLAGTFNINIPNDGVPHTANGGCAWPVAAQLVALWPHLHARGTHANLVITPAQPPVTQTLLDAPYTFDTQLISPASFALHAGDLVGVTCTYVNDTAITPLTFGDSVDSEQCFVGMYVAPSTGLTFLGCVSN